ncbi:MAG: mechanosensitive ion channel family protein [bacterium]
MKHSGPRALAISVVLFFSCLLFPRSSAAAAEPAIQAPEAPEGQDIRRTVELLENPEKVRELTRQLKLLLEAQERTAAAASLRAAEPAEPPSVPLSAEAVKLVRTYKQQLQAGLDRVWNEIRGVRQSLERFKAYLSTGDNLQRFTGSLIKIALALALSTWGWLLGRRQARKLLDRRAYREPSGLAERVNRALVGTFFHVYPWLGLFLFFLVLSLFFPKQAVLRAVFLLETAAVAVYFGLKGLAYFFLSPDRRELRVVPARDEGAHYAFIWIHRFLLFSLWMIACIVPSAVMRRPALLAVFLGLWQVGIVVLASVLLAQQRSRIERSLRLASTGKESRFVLSAKKAVNFFVGRFYVVLIAYMGVVVTCYLLGWTDAYEYLLSCAGKSLLVLVLGAGLWLLWRLLFGRLFQVSAAIKEKYPLLEAHVNRYIPFIGKAGYAVILVVTALSLLDAWGVDVYAFLASHPSVVSGLVHIPLIVFAAVLLTQAGTVLIAKLEQHAAARMQVGEEASKLEAEKRVSTLGGITRKASFVTIWAAASMMILAEMGFDIKPILAGAGIVGVAVGFGAQSLVKDVIGGLFLLMENRIRVGDVALINGTGGLVEQVNLRTTVLRDLSGTVHMFPNGSIQTLSNMTHEFSFYVFDVGVAYKEDTDRVIEILRELGEEMTQEEAYRSSILEPLEILGVDRFDNSAVVIKARIKTLPIKQWLVGREMNRRIKKRFDELGIEIPFPHQSFYFGEASKPITVKMEGSVDPRQEIREIVREMLASDSMAQLRSSLPEQTDRRGPDVPD